MSILAPKTIVSLGEDEAIWVDEGDYVEVVVVDKILGYVIAFVVSGD